MVNSRAELERLQLAHLRELLRGLLPGNRFYASRLAGGVDADKWVTLDDYRRQVTFTTIVPGCYAGRYPHIHFEVFSSLANATSGNYAVLISQLAIPAAVCEAVYADSSVYGASLSRFRNTSIASDNIFGDNSSAQTAVMTLTTSGSASAGYSANTTVGIAT